MQAPAGASAAEASAAERRAAEVSLDISRHLARIDVAAASFSSGSDSSSEEGDSTDSLDVEGSESVVRSSTDAAGAAEATATALAPAETAHSNGRRDTSGGEFFAEPEWQRVPGRWAKFEDKLLREMKAELQEDLRAAPPFPEVVGSRRMLRFLRGHRHDAHKAAGMMRQMLQWRKDNGVDAIREDIMQNQKFHPSQFPEGEMITRLFPLLVANPLCVDMDGAPISYESYEFSPRQVTAHANGDLGFFIKFHIYCQEFKQICLDSLSDAKEMENLARRAADRATSPPPPPSPPPQPPRETAPGNSVIHGAPISNSNGGPSKEVGRRAGKNAGGGDLPPSPPREVGRQTSGEAEGAFDSDRAAAREGKEEEPEEEEEEPWGVVLRNTIIRDLAGFGMEHAGPIGRSLISQVLAVSQDNYPEMMEKCYIINAPWVFYALWKGLTPLVSANTAKKVQVLKYDFLANLCETISLERLPTSAGGGCDPTQATPDQVHDFVVCGRVAGLAGTGEDEEGSSGGGGGGGTDEEGEAGTAPEAEAELEQAFSSGGVAGLGAGRRGAAEGVAGVPAAGNGAGDGAAAPKRGGKPHVTFRSLFERLQARDEPTSAVRPRRSGSGSPPPPLSRASSFQCSSVSSPPLSRQGSTASLVGGGGGGTGRPFASPGPRGVRRATTAGVGGGGGDGASGERSPSLGDEQAEDFDSRLVGRALRLSMKRKAQRFKTAEGGGGIGGAGSVYDEQDVAGRGDSSLSPSPGPSPGPSPPPTGSLGGGRSPEEQERERKGGWAKKKWRALRERRESKKMLEKGFLADLPGLSAGDCAEWIPNSARNSCLHCERPFTLLLRRHHCRMCGELVCGHCSPHRVRLAEDGKDKEAAVDGGSDAAAGGGGGGSEGGGEGASSHRRHGNGGGSKRSRHARKEKKGGAPKPLAVRVCTDCHFSLQTVTVASASAIAGRGGGSGASSGVRGRGGSVNDNADGSGDDRNGSGNGESLPRSIGEGGGDGADAGAGAGAGTAEVVPEGGLDLDLGGAGAGLGFVASLEAVYSTEEIAGDVVLGDVLEWGRIQRRASKCVEVVRMCLLVVVELHHKKLLEMGLRLWRSSSAAMSSAAKHAAATLAASNGSSSLSSSSSGQGQANSSSRHSLGDGGISASATPPAVTAATVQASAQPSLPSSSDRTGKPGDGGASNADGGASSSLREGSPVPPCSTPRAAAAAAGAAATAQGEPYARSSEVVVASAEAAVWAIVDKAAAFRYSVWVVLVAMLPLLYRLR